MGSNSVHAEDSKCKNCRAKYLKILRKSQAHFATCDILEDAYNERLSYDSSVVNDNMIGGSLDWKLIFESYLEEKKDEYFWADDLL